MIVDLLASTLPWDGMPAAPLEQQRALLEGSSVKLAPEPRRPWWARALSWVWGVMLKHMGAPR